MNALNLLRSRFPTTPRLCGGEHCIARRFLSFSFAGPRKLSEILKLDLLEGQSASEISDIWYTYHESRVSYKWEKWDRTLPSVKSPNGKAHQLATLLAGKRRGYLLERLRRKESSKPCIQMVRRQQFEKIS